MIHQLGGEDEDLRLVYLYVPPLKNWQIDPNFDGLIRRALNIDKNLTIIDANKDQRYSILEEIFRSSNIYEGNGARIYDSKAHNMRMQVVANKNYENQVWIGVYSDLTNVGEREIIGSMKKVIKYKLIPEGLLPSKSIIKDIPQFFYNARVIR